MSGIYESLQAESKALDIAIKRKKEEKENKTLEMKHRNDELKIKLKVVHRKITLLDPTKQTDEEFLDSIDAIELEIKQVLEG